MICGHSGFARRAYWHGFGLFSGQGRFFGPGEVRLALLSMLGEAPMHGYELMKRLEERSGGIYRASAGTVYPTLQQLEDEGLVASETEDGKKIYRLTDAGRHELERNDEAVRAIWRRAQRWQEGGGSVAYRPMACLVMYHPSDVTSPNAPGSRRRVSTMVAMACIE